MDSCDDSSMLRQTTHAVLHGGHSDMEGFAASSYHADAT